jgi:hypothetical protein
MVQGISSPGGALYTAPAKPTPTAQPNTTPGAAPVATPQQAPGGGRPVRAANTADGDKHKPDERAVDRSIPKERSAPLAAGVTELSIGHDDAANRYVYKGVDEQTKEVRQQWPSEEALKRIAKLRELSGRIVDEIL